MMPSPGVIQELVTDLVLGSLPNLALIILYTRAPTTRTKRREVINLSLVGISDMLLELEA